MNSQKPPANTWPPTPPSLLLARFQTVPTQKASYNQSESFSCCLELAGVQTPHEANLWKTLGPLKNVTMVKEIEAGGKKKSKQWHYAALYALSRQTDAKWNPMADFWLKGVILTPRALQNSTDQIPLGKEFCSTQESNKHWRHTRKRSTCIQEVITDDTSFYSRCCLLVGSWSRWVTWFFFLGNRVFCWRLFYHSRICQPVTKISKVLLSPEVNFLMNI